MKKLLLILFLAMGMLSAKAQSNISVFSTNPDGVYIQGEVMTYTVMVTNTGPQPASNVLVFMAIPANIPMPPGILKFWWTGSNGSSGTNINLSNTIPTLAVNQTVTYTINIRIPSDYELEIPDVRVTYASRADLEVINTNNQTNYVPGETSTYNVTVTNHGPEDAYLVRVQNAIPAGMTNFAWSGNGASGTTAMNNIINVLPVGGTVTYTVSFDVPATYTGSLTSQTTLNVSVTDPVPATPACAQCTDTDAPNQANLVVLNTNNRDNYLPGHESVYTLTVTNTGPFEANQVAVINPIPAGITAFSWTGSNGSSGTNEELQDVINSLAAGQTVTYTITLMVPADHEDPTLVSTAEVTSPSDADFTCTGCTDTDTAPSGPNVTVSVTDGQEFYTPGPGNSLVYTVVISNDGPGDAESIEFEFGFDPLATGAAISWTSSEGGSGSETGTGQLSIETIPLIEEGESITYTITAGPWPDAYDDLITAGVSLNVGTVPATVHCIACSDTDVAEYADITVTNTNDQEYYLGGGSSVYTVTVTNNGPAPAANVHVSNAIPTGITGFSWTGSNSSSGTDIAIDDTIASLGVGESVTYTINLDVPAGHTGDLVSETVVTSDTTDPTPACADCTDTDLEAVSANIITTKTLASGTQYTAGTNAIYMITVTNDGPSPALNISVQDIVPAGLVAADASWTATNGASGTGDLIDTIALLGVDEIVTYTFTIPVPSGFSPTANITNTVTVTSATPDPVPGCTTCTVTATPNPLANIITLKTNGQTTYLVNEQTTYTITVSNPGPSDAYNVVVSDPKPANIQMMTWAGNEAAGSGAMQNTIPVLPAGESVTYTVTIFVPENYADTTYLLKNTVTVTSATPDPVPDCLGCVDEDTPRGKFVTVTQNQYSIDELVRDVLIDVQCIDISNITWSAGPGDMGIGYFQKNNSTFPVKSGVVMHAGNSMMAGGPNSGMPLSTGNWGGDAQLLAYIQSTGFDPFVNSYNDVSKIEFDFIPLSSNMSFEFIFASDEYGDFQCSFTDAFAFFLTHVPSNITTNLAVVPSTTTPISVTTIRNAMYNGGCGSVNPGFFGAWYGENAALPIAQNAPINFDGRTTKMVAASQVEPGDLYHIKLVIGDRNDNAWDSAVFLAAGSFDIGQPTLPDDITIAAGTALCPDEEYTLTVNLTPGTDFDITWEKNGVQLMDGNNPITATSITVTEPGIYTVLASFPSAPECNLTDSMRIEYRPEIEAAQPNDLTVCGNPNGTATFDLTENYDVLMSTIPNPDMYEVFYFESEEQIDDNDSIIFPANHQGTDGQTIYVTLMGFDNSCITVREFDLHILDCNVPLNQPETVHVCEDAPYDAHEIFDLTAQEDEMLAGLDDPTIYDITYHTTETGAQNGDEDIIQSPASFNGTTQTIYVRAQDPNNPLAYGVTQFNLIVTPQPFFEDLEDIEVCDSYTLPVFDEGDYYTGADGTGTLLADGSVITDSQIIYRYKIEGTAPYTCVYQNSFEVTVNETPEVDTPDDVQVCGSYTLPALTAGDYFDANNDPLAVGDEITETQQITISAQTGTNVICSDTYTFTVTINNSPVLVPATDLEECDDDFDGFTTFNLVPAGEEVVNGADNLTITYHSTLDLAQSGVEDIDDPAAYQSAPGSIFIRAVETGTTTNCYSVEEVLLIVHARPAVPEVTNYVVCDDNNSPDGLEIFDLTTKNAEATQDPEVTVTYFTSLAGAEDGQVDRITNVTAYESGNAQIWVRVESDFGCYSTSSFELVVNPLPLINTNMEPLFSCEEEPGLGEFDLMELDEIVTMGASGVSVSYYASLDEAALGDDATALPATYMSPTTTIYARIENTLTECVVIGPVELEVLPAPIATEPAPLNVCDPNNDDVTVFNLDPVLAQIEAQLGNVVTAVPFETYNDAFYNAVNNVITNTTAYTNVEAFTTGGVQTIYIRVGSDQTECFDIVELQLVVQPVPEAVKPQPYELCDNGGDDTDGIANFDLTTLEEEILGGIDPAQFPVTFFENEDAAIANTGAIQAPASYNSPTATIVAKVTNTATGCYDIVEVELIVNPLPVANPPAPYTLCDLNAPGDEIEVFDLNTKIDEIITTPEGMQDGLIVTFFKNYNDAVAGT
ncbi:MAG: choice-of-anchor L domain-containing protein, partial [Flavobacterium sp.]